MKNNIMEQLKDLSAWGNQVVNGALRNHSAIGAGKT
jgi:hypothetical protein